MDLGTHINPFLSKLRPCLTRLSIIASHFLFLSRGHLQICMIVSSPTAVGTKACYQKSSVPGGISIFYGTAYERRPKLNLYQPEQLTIILLKIRQIVLPERGLI